MLRPLNADNISALLRDDVADDPMWITQARRQLGSKQELMEEGALADGLNALFWTQAYLEARVHHKDEDEIGDEDEGHQWYVYFRDPPFNSLTILPTSKTAIDIYAYGKLATSFDLLNGLNSSIAMLKWIENYGYERQIEKANNGTALLPLDYKKFNALKRQGDYAGCDDLKDALDFFAVKDVGPAIHSLLQAFKLGMSRLNQVTMRSETWHIDFRKSPLRTLRIQPGDDHDSVGIYAKGKLLANFRLFECSKYFVSDLVMRQRLLSFIWQYGNDRIQERLKYEATQHPQTKKLSGYQTKAKRSEKPLLHRVLHTAGFKAQRDMKLNAKAEKAVSEKKDVIMEDVESNFAPQELLQSQPLTPELPLRDVVRNMQLGFPLEQENKDIGQETKALHVDDVNVGRLHIANCQR